MFVQSSPAATAYRRVAVESATLGADPHQLIALLLAGAMTAIGEARAALGRKDVAAKVAAATRAMRIVDEGLKAVVDRSASPIGESLYELYDYCTRRLLHAQLHNDDAAFAEVSGLLAQIREGWAGIAPGRGAALRHAA